MCRFVTHCALCAALCAAFTSMSQPARAADTVETWAVGATDVDFYLGAEGLGLSRAEQSLYGDIMLGYGIVDRLSVYLGTTFAGDGRFEAGVYEPYTGVFATVVETPAIDLDLFLHLCLHGETLHVSPSFELNLDADPDQLSWGLYLRSGVDVGGAGPDTADTGAGGLVWTLDATAGAYWTVHEGHQLLLELDVAAPLHPTDAARPVELGGVALGYNVGLRESIELINQVWLDLPQTGADPLAIAVTTGFIATLP